MADTAQPESTRPKDFGNFIQTVKDKKLDTCLWLTRLMTLYFTFHFFFPFFANPNVSYGKCLAAAAATSALRLHQRLPRVQFNLQFVDVLINEDSAHYLIFCVIFWLTEPITIALLPVVLFAALHSASFTLTLLDSMGQNNIWIARTLISFVELQSRNILRMVAFTEIFLMPISIVFIFVGRASLITPFMYFRFLKLRYGSRRNPYTRSVFHELRLATEQMAMSPKCPQAARTLIHKSISFISGMAPVVQAQ